MPKYLVEMHDGRKFQVEADSQPSEAEVLAHMSQNQPEDAGPKMPPAAPPADRGGVMHPLTSMLAPELEQARSGLNAATAVPAGQPFMARSRTGALYPSETGTGAVNAAKSVARGAGGVLLDQVEGATSPLGMATAGAGAAARTLPMRTIASTALRGAGTVLNNPIVGALEPRLPHAGKIATRFADAIGRTPGAAEDATLGGQVAHGADQYTMARTPSVPDAGLPSEVRPLSPHMDLSQPMQPGQMTQQQIGERFAAAKAQGYQPPPKPISGPLVHRDLYGKNPTPPLQVDTASLPESWKPLADTQQPHPLDPMRKDIGAAQTGRAAGMSKQEVRDAATPILGAEPGAASPILPEKALQKIVDTLKELPRGGPEREAYVARATSGKTQWQVENIRRTLEHLGLVAPLAIGGAGLRGAMLSQLNGEQK